ncbi:2-keto-4-pentenoate hydratase/2-oxohepta-3-ene-1,7-dioic acid hydratase in catechol pathway/uncharacterized damage-inducible protein DinB [Evansella vedderi]|uniref:2-keto-4-pentenoate hydratase/2-oxohepta-3-ene-1,7-dioic acid hydratase in catechol pathway/uncharacterized damage-inducible protein DinB n=1 Tax=Evansella vedderi TaxID=38282 RepID=A0ABT9ZQ29_9BACI|nr:2-keto-4-pentenoate hydratase/2-oxohepta-3-ene-1,7-dioic acid hydratase in catechol pathway/uncharacterized damage-inducible protein DinB [Evansella vedderi]
MKLITFDPGNGLKVGALIENDMVVDLQTAYKEKLAAEGEVRALTVAKTFIPNKTNEFLQGGDSSLDAAKEAISFVKGRLDTSSAVYEKGSVKIGAPVPEPQKIICVGHNYREHILEMKREIPKYPVLFAKFANTVIGPEDDIPYFPITEKLDYEAELGVVIGKRAKDVPQEDALDYVAGYTIVNDVTSRDLQKRTLQWLQGKSVDGSAPMGPWLVTKDEIPSPDGLEISLTVNGEERQRSNTANLVFSVPHLVEYLSSIMTLEPGDVICSGTPGGVGVAMEPPTFLQDGDVVAITVDKVGTLENTVRKVEKETVKNYVAEINNRLSTIIDLGKNQTEETLRWKPAENKWSIVDVLCHVEEAHRFWLHELERTVKNPETKYGRGLDHYERLAAVENTDTVAVSEVLNKLQRLKSTIRSTLLSLNDRDLLIEATHKNPKFGTRPLSFLLDHFMVEHQDKHIAQINRNIEQFNSHTVTTK